MKNIFKRLLNVKGMVVEDVSIDDSPLRPAPVLVVRVRRRKGALRCSRCGRKCPSTTTGGGERRWRHQDFGCYGIELMGLAPCVACAEHGVVVAQVPWAEPGSRFDNVRVLAHFRIPALMERDVGRAGYDFQSSDNEKSRLERGAGSCPRKSYGSARPCSRASSTPWRARRSSGSSTRCPTLQADEIANAARYERSGGRKAYRAGHYERGLTAKAGRLELKVPKLKGALFESAVIERCRRREESVGEALIDMYLAGVSTRQVDDTGQLPWGDRMPSRTLSDKLKRVYAEIDEWRTGPLDDEYPYAFVDGVWHKRSWGGSVENVGILVAIGVSKDGHREVIGVAEGMREDSASWEQFVRSMIERGLGGVRLVVGDRCAGLVSTVNSMLPNAKYQRCMVHFMRNVLSKVPPSHRDWPSAALKAIFAMESRESALAKAGEVASEMESRKLKTAANCLREGIGETTVYLLAEFPNEHRRRIRTNDMFYGRGSRDWRYCWVLAWFSRVRAVVRRVVGDVRR